MIKNILIVDDSPVARKFLRSCMPEVLDYQAASIIEQNFWSKFKGVTLLIFSGDAGKALLSIIGKNDTNCLL